MTRKFFYGLAVAATMMFAVSCCNTANKTSKYRLGTSPEENQWIESTLAEMTLDEKIAIVHAQSKFSSPGVPRLGIPEIWCTDGPHGIRPEVLWDEWDQAGWTNDSITAFPALTALAATWNPSLAHLYGNSIGEEARYRKKSVLLGPGVNIARTPLNGRNFEYMGEDPYLASKMVVEYVNGVQEKGVAVCVKHYALNNQEHFRHTTDVTVDDRTLYEIYLPAFKAAVTEGNAWSIMGAYNIFRGQHLCHNDLMLNKILKEEWGFDGVVISDWGGVHDTREAITNGMDLEFGTWTDGLTMGATNGYNAYYLADAYKELIKSGEYTTKELDDKVRRILRLELRTNLNTEAGFGRLTCPDHYAAARKIGGESVVLLKNEGNVLPVKNGAKILVVGENAVKMMTVGGGSSSLKVQHEISPLDGLKARFGAANVAWERGYVGDPSGEYNGVVTGQDLSESRSESQLIADAVKAAANADYVIFIGGLNKSDHQDCEGVDRFEYKLPYNQDAVVSALAAVAKNFVVVNISGTPVQMPWADEVPAIVQDWYIGSEAGYVLADVLSGDVNPSGKLPFTYPVVLEDGPLKTLAQYPGIPGEDNLWHEEYTEGIFVGYRWYDTQNVPVRFAFGHGLSYTEFEYGEAKVSSATMKKDGTIEVSVPVKNVGKVAGAEVVQLYISDSEAAVVRPAKELKGFDKVWLEPGETKTVKFTVDASALSWFDADKHEWVAEAGEFTAHVAAAADDIRSSVKFNLK